MAVFYNVGENKRRPGVYQRHVNSGNGVTVGSQDGICAIPVQASWGPLGEVLTNSNAGDLTRNYGIGTYGAGYTVLGIPWADPGGADPRASLNHPIGSSDGRCVQRAGT